MPIKEVKTIRDLIYYQYAKIIAKSAMGPDSKKNAYGFIKNRFRELRDDGMKWSDILPPLPEKIFKDNLVLPYMQRDPRLGRRCKGPGCV